MTDSDSKTPAQEWDKVRAAFMSSIMVDTALSSLAQNLEGPDWPIKDKGETPANYIDLDYADLQALLAQKGFPQHADILVALLKDTLSFDDPFGDMVQHTEAASERDNQLLRNMAKLEIGEDFPISLTALNSDALEFCRTEKMSTLGEFARFAQSMSQNVIVGGDFRKLLNALSHIDEKALREVIPYRPGSKGLHLLECLSQMVSAGSAPERIQTAFVQFKPEWEALQHEVEAGGDLSRLLMVLNDAEAEKRVAAIIQPKLTEAGIGVVKVEKTGILAAFSRMFRK